jgi:hypothetical protein
MWDSYTLHHFKVDNMEHADDELFYLALFTNILSFSPLYSTECQTHQT